MRPLVQLLLQMLIGLPFRDTFTGNYALEYVRQKHYGDWDIRKAVECGSKAGAKTIEQLGAQESIPGRTKLTRGNAETLFHVERGTRIHMPRRCFISGC
jgi:hypothetical protein